jgi:ABC-type polysaccharide/polyol phosphate export permease
MYGNVVELVSDFEGNRVINYNLILPFPSWLALLSKSAYYFIVYFVFSLLMFFVGKITLWNQLDLTQIFYFKFIVSLILQSLFFSCFVLWVSSLVDSMHKMGSVWARYIFPLWFMGGFQFSWVALHKALPIVAYINLLNPMMYITEATRASLLGQTDYINFWICTIAIIIFSLACFVLGLRNLKKRLDFV